MNARLPQHLRDKLLSLPESGYGYQVVTVFLEDGQHGSPAACRDCHRRRVASPV
jgi:hypothetical protein